VPDIDLIMALVFIAVFILVTYLFFLSKKMRPIWADFIKFLFIKQPAEFDFKIPEENQPPRRKEDHEIYSLKDLAYERLALKEAVEKWAAQKKTEGKPLIIERPEKPKPKKTYLPGQRKLTLMPKPGKKRK